MIQKQLNRRLFAAAAIVGGGLLPLILFSLAGSNRLLLLLGPLPPLLLTAAVVGQIEWQQARGRARAGLWLAAAGALLWFGGLALMFWLRVEVGWLLMLVGMLVHPLGLLIAAFGGGPTSVRIIMLLMGLSVVAGVIIEGLEDRAGTVENDYGFVLMLFGLAIGWVLLGGLLLRNVRPSLVAPGAMLLLLLLVACSGSDAGVRISEPRDGATVSSPVTVEMQADNFVVEAAGEIREGAGHMHIIIDSDCVAAGSTIPNDDSHRHFGDGSTTAVLELTPGEHTLCLQGADGAHVALAGLTDEITIEVQR